MGRAGRRRGQRGAGSSGGWPCNLPAGRPPTFATVHPSSPNPASPRNRTASHASIFALQCNGKCNATDSATAPTCIVDHVSKVLHAELVGLIVGGCTAGGEGGTDSGRPSRQGGQAGGGTRQISPCEAACLRGRWRKWGGKRTRWCAQTNTAQAHPGWPPWRCSQAPPVGPPPPPRPVGGISSGSGGDDRISCIQVQRRQQDQQQCVQVQHRTGGSRGIQ